MTWRKGLCAGLLFVLSLIFLFPTTPIEAFITHNTLYVGHISDRTGTPYEVGYTYRDEITHHAYTFDAAAGDVLTLTAVWITDPPPAGFGDPWQPDLIITPGVPPVGEGEVFVWDLSADIRAGNILPEDMNNRGNRLEDWEVRASGTYTLYVKCYPYQESSGGIYAVSIGPGAAAPSDPSAASSEGWTGEFPQVEGGDYYIASTIDGNPSWAVHSFQADPGDMLSIMAWNHLDTPADGLTPRLVLCEGGCDPANPDALVSDDRNAGIAVINYTVPESAPAGTLYTALLDGGATTGDYSLWMRRWRPEDLATQLVGGWMGELAMTESGDLRMGGTLANNDAFKVHSFRADPGDSVTVTVTAKRDTPADELIPVVLLVPGGYEPGEQWLAMDAAADDEAILSPVIIPSRMPPDTLYTVVVADTSNAGQLLFGEEAYTGYAGGYEVVVRIN